jgi:dihydroorotase
VLLRGGRVIDPSRKLDERLDLLLADGKIAASGRDLDVPKGGETVDVSGLVVAPGFVDLHVHLREPGDEHKESASGDCGGIHFDLRDAEHPAAYR